MSVKNVNLIKALRLLENETPLSVDCGKICGGICCQGDAKTGMELLPGEKDLLQNEPGFTVIEEGAPYGLLVCEGKCNRQNRPWACRIFPFAPLITNQKGRTAITIVPDPRAVICPMHQKDVPPEESFVKALRRSTRYLLQDPETALAVYALSDEIKEILLLRDRLQ